MPTKPLQAACHRSNSLRHGGRIDESGCAPRYPSRGDMCGPSTWMKGMHAAATGSSARASLITRSRYTMSFSGDVQTVGANVVTPVASKARANCETVLAHRSGLFTSKPRYPFTCKSTRPAEIQGWSAASTDSTRTILPFSMESRTPRPVAGSRPDSRSRLTDSSRSAGAINRVQSSPELELRSR
jgi:hypothetical protein